eukprot:4554472-Amphidinium_carterae.1
MAEKLRIAQEEVMQLTPDPRKLQHVGGLMSDYQVLMNQMEDSSKVSIQQGPSNPTRKEEKRNKSTDTADM